MTRKELFDKKPLKFKTEDEAKSMLNGLDHKYRTNYKIVKIKEGTCGYGEGGKLGEKPAGPHLLKRKKKKQKAGHGPVFVGGCGKGQNDADGRFLRGAAELHRV